jgi:hypothetical protein
MTKSARLMLPKHACELSITHNPHLNNYMSVAQAIEAEDHGFCDWVSPEERQLAIETNEAWVVQWYPNTPVGFCIIAASTLEALNHYFEAASGDGA